MQLSVRVFLLLEKRQTVTLIFTERESGRSPPLWPIICMVCSTCGLPIVHLEYFKTTKTSDGCKNCEESRRFTHFSLFFVFFFPLSFHFILISSSFYTCIAFIISCISFHVLKKASVRCFSVLVQVKLTNDL